MTDVKTGETLFSEGKIEEAEKYFLKIVGEDSGNKVAYNNLGVVAFQKQDIVGAIDYFAQSLEIDPFYKDAAVNLSGLLKTLNRLHEAVPFLERIIERHSNDEELIQILEDARSTAQARLKVAVLCIPGLESFLSDIINFLSRYHDVRTCYSSNQKEIELAVKWADIVWLEWANELTVALTNHANILEGKRVVCRLHSYEAFAGYMQKIKWERINDVIFVADHIKNFVIQQIPKLADFVQNIHVIPNGIDLNKFTFKERRKGFNLAYIGYINYKKGPMLLLHAFRELAQINDKYHLFVAGVFQDARYDLYFRQMIQEMGLEKNFHFDGWVEDINGWLDDKQYAVCTSVLEGHPVGLMEAMARGLKPVIHNFVGARGLYPEKYIWNTIPEFVQKITESSYDSSTYRHFIAEHYSLGLQLKKLKKIFGSDPVPQNAMTQLDQESVRSAIYLDQHSFSEDLECPKKDPSGRGSRKTIPTKTSLQNKEKGILQEDIKSYYNGFLEYLEHDHQSTNPRHQKAKQTLKNIIRSGMTVLDIGCGTGITSKSIAELGANVVGVDISDKLIEFAQIHSAHKNVRYIVADATVLDLKEKFDVISIIDVMEHILSHRLSDFLGAISRHASEKTVIYLNIPDGRYQRYIRIHHPDRLQIVDEDYDPDLLVSLFKEIGFQPYYICIYGLDAPVQYNEYLFMKDEILGGVYSDALKKFGMETSFFLDEAGQGEHSGRSHVVR